MFKYPSLGYLSLNKPEGSKQLKTNNIDTHLVPRAFPYPFFKGKALGTRLYRYHLILKILTL